MLKNGGFVSDGEFSGSIQEDGTSISKLKDEKTNHLHWSNSFHQSYFRLARLLVEDGIAANVDNLMIDISADYVALNGRILSTPVEKTYEYHLRQLSGFQSKDISIIFKENSK